MFFFRITGEIYDPDEDSNGVTLRNITKTTRPLTCPPDDPSFLVSTLPKPAIQNGADIPDLYKVNPRSPPRGNTNRQFVVVPKSPQSQSAKKEKVYMNPPQERSPGPSRKSFSPSLLRRSFFNRTKSSSKPDLTSSDDKCDVCGFPVNDDNSFSLTADNTKRLVYHKSCFKCSK
ncbi:hypothetical protein FSP39_012349 [Pinctada imbricata]|uniref:Uncharacterized protein n=1 Tax=Pinctada imbricata TaxID=66713 RepID=A0AA88YPM6_PINIB|nr:hypothetical protein FSP39_012349 [Pinctada imbricata]